MSSGNKSLASSGARSTNKNKSSHGNHSKSDHHQSKSSDTSKHDKGQNKDQSRNAQIIDTRMGGTEDPVLKEQIKQVMDMTRRSEDEVIMALHDSDGDLDRAVNDLLEGVQTEWEVKKKKARQPGGSKQNADQSGDVEESGDWEDRRNQRGGGPPRLRGRANHDNRGWRGRENKENERNMEDNVRDGGYGGGRRGGRGGPGRSGRGGRGGGRGLGPRTFANRGDAPSSSSAHSFSRPIDTWTGSEEQQQSNQEPKMDAWNNLEPSEDWDNEEYTGSLADTKVFTPSTLANDSATGGEESKGPEAQLPIAQSPAQAQANLATLQQEDSSKLSESSGALQSQQSGLHQQQQQQAQSVLGMPGQIQQQLSQQQQPSIVGGAALTAAQSQYLTQLTQQSSESFKSTGQSAFSSITMASQPQRQAKQRPRVPPPSKIPSSAVEMPGDTVNSNIGFLDVQFGVLELCSDSGSLDGSATDKYNPSTTTISGIDVSSTAATAAAVAAAAAASSATTSNSLDIETAQQGTGTNQCYNATSQMVSPSNASVAYGTTTAYPSSQKTSYQGSNAAPSSYNAYTSSGAQSGQSSFPTASGGNANNYTSTTSVTQASYNASSSYPQSNASTYSQASPSASAGASASAAATSVYNQTTTANQAYQSAASGFVPSTTAQYQTPQSASSNVGVSNNSNTGGYQASSYQGSSSFPSTPQAYQPSATTFTSPITQASSGGAYQNAAHSVYASAYGNYSTQPQAASHNHNKLNSGGNKDSQYESNATTSSGSLATTSAPTLGSGGGGLSSSSSVNSSQTKSTSSNAVPKSTSSGVVTGAGGTGSMTGAGGNMTPILNNQYIMGQGVPYAAFHQPMYSYEDLQLMQQRIPPHMTTGPATSLGGGRGDTLSGVQTVQGVQGVQGAYTSMSDARFARNDSNASPVPSTMSQQTATQHQQPMMNPTLPPGYAYFAYGAGIMPGSFQYGTPAIYPQIATTGNAGTNSGAYSAKPGNYGSGYGGGASYDTLASAGPTGEYKGAGSGYTGTQSGKTGTSTGNNNSGASSGADIGATMYAKSHVALGKVNSYDKQTFHSATPPPFNLTGSQSAGMPGGYGAPHLFISTMPHQLHQPLHQDGGSSSGQRSNASSQNKAQAKPGYSSAYWNPGN